MIDKLKILQFYIDNSELPHKSIYHKESFYEHCLLVVYYAIKTNNKDIIEAAMLHDILKPGTQDFNKRRDPCFYGHEKLSLKEAEEFGCSENYIVTLVNLHMLPYIDPKWKTCKKIQESIKIYGDKVVKDVETLHECDVNGTIKENRIIDYNNIQEAIRYLKNN